MSRHARRGRDGDDEEQAWRPAGDRGSGRDDEAGNFRAATRTAGPYRRAGSAAGSRGGSGPAWEQTGPPWEQPGWDEQGYPPPGAGGPDLTGGHPSGPLPPLPPPLDDWREDPSVTGYAGPDDARHPGYAGPGYGQHDYPGPDAGYTDGAGYPAPAEDYREAGGEFAGAGPGYAADDTGYYHHSAGYSRSGTGYVPGAGYRDGYPPAGEDGEDDYPADSGAYPVYPGGAAGRGDGDRDQPDEYDGRGGWYGDEVDDQPAWPEEEYEDEFLPGLSTGTHRRTPQSPPAGRAAGGRAKRKRKRGRRVAPLIALTVILAILAGAGVVGYHYYRTYFRPPDYSGDGYGTVVVQIMPGDSATAVGERLQKLGVVASVRAFSNAAKANPHGNALEPGFFRVHKHMQASLALALLLNPASREETTITIPEGWRLSQIIAALGKNTGNLTGYQQAIKETAKLNLPSLANGNPEGFLFPATYKVQPDTQPIKVLRDMVTRFDEEATSLNLRAAAAHLLIKERTAVIVASLVQAEGGRTQDFPKIARVIYNRLFVASPPMKLGLDSTIMYALHTSGIMATSQQLSAAAKSRYDTYTHAGLPPGPIDSPGDAALKAALHPAHGDWLYFVTVDPKTGLTKFTSSPAQFSQWKAELEKNIRNGT